jgi:hypothetical protein
MTRKLHVFVAMIAAAGVTVAMIAAGQGSENCSYSDCSKGVLLFLGSYVVPPLIYGATLFRLHPLSTQVKIVGALSTAGIGGAYMFAGFLSDTTESNAERIVSLVGAVGIFGAGGAVLAYGLVVFSNRLASRLGGSSPD